jgi:hypothetical protein
MNHMIINGQYAPDYPLNPEPEEEHEEVCDDCGLTYDECKCYSPCCGVKMSGGNGDSSFADYGICPECGEHI